jgi:hypothetical protein
MLYQLDFASRSTRPIRRAATNVVKNFFGPASQQGVKEASQIAVPQVAQPDLIYIDPADYP